MKRLLAFLIIINLPIIYCLPSCSNVMKTSQPKFHLVAPCSISGMNILARTNATSVKRCSVFATLKQGLAFSFQRPGNQPNASENCLVYDCPESEVLQSIKRKKNIDYYSLYADPLPSEDTICLVGVGIFKIHENRTNYTEAKRICSEESGELTSVLSSKRTKGLSKIINYLKLGKLAYVGLDDIEQEGKFRTISGQLASCFEYRAWGLGEPKSRRKEYDCVALNKNNNWQVIDCSRKLPFICEILPKGPFPIQDRKVKDTCRLDLSNRKLIKRISENKEFYKKSLFFYWISNYFSIQ